MSAHTYHFFSTRYATRYHIARVLKERGWQESSTAETADFSDANLTLNDEVAQQFEYKHLLANLVARYCPEMMPKTYVIDDHNINVVLAQLIHENYIQPHRSQSESIELKWILKPGMLNNAEHIHLFNTADALQAHFKTSKRLGGPHVIQQYISNPDLIEGRKYTFRLHVIMTNYAGVFMMKEGYMNISAWPFDIHDQFKNRKAHITNYVLDEEFSNIEQRLASSLPQFPQVYEQMQQIVAKTTKALLKQAPYFLAPQKTKVFEIFGYDFMLDDKGKLWLLEINQSPDMPMFEDNPMKAPLWQPFWQNIVDEFVIPIALQQAPQQQYHYYQQCFSASDAFPFWRRVWTKLSCRSFIQ